MFKKAFASVCFAVSSLFVMVGSAHAALSTELTTMLTDIKTDGVAAATLVLGAVVGVYVVKFIRKAL